jgi:hypothetical protein
VTAVIALRDALPKNMSTTPTPHPSAVGVVVAPHPQGIGKFRYVAFFRTSCSAREDAESLLLEETQVIPFRVLYPCERGRRGPTSNGSRKSSHPTLRPGQ